MKQLEAGGCVVGVSLIINSTPSPPNQTNLKKDQTVSNQKHCFSTLLDKFRVQINHFDQIKQFDQFSQFDQFIATPQLKSKLKTQTGVGIIITKTVTPPHHTGSFLISFIKLISFIILISFIQLISFYQIPYG